MSLQLSLRSLWLAGLLAATALPNEADAKKHHSSSSSSHHKTKQCHGNCVEALPLVDVSGPLHVERDQFGRPMVVGTPKKGPKHGIGSYWYQVGLMYGEADAVDNFAVIVADYLEATGRFAEFVIGYDTTLDVHSRRTTMTTPQYEQQLVTEAGNYPEDMVDFIKGLQQGYINHIIKIENGEQPLPADFVTDVGIFNWFWDERDIVAPELFTVVNFIRVLENANDVFGSTTTAWDQVQYGVNFGQGIATFYAGLTGTPTSDAIDLTNDILGVPERNFRFTAKEGDRAGMYCPTKKPSRYTHTVDEKKTGSSLQKRKMAALRKAPTKNVAKMDDEQVEQFKAKLESGEIAPQEKRRMSDFLIVGPKLTKDKSTMMFGNSQIPNVLDDYLVSSTIASRYNTPRGATYAADFAPNFTRSQSGCALNYSVEVTQVATRDGIFEDSNNLVLIYDENSDTEHVSGGKAHSTIKVRQPNGTVTEFFVTIYQGNTERPGLELDVPLYFPANGFSGSSRVPDPENPDNEFVAITRHPCDWMKEVSGYLTYVATLSGMVPFDTVEEFAEHLSTSPIPLMVGGIDNDGNIFSISEGLYPTVVPKNDNPPLNRAIVAGDATASQYFSNFCAIPLPYVDDVEYKYKCKGSRLAKNPSCGFITAWNNIWSNDSQQGADTSGEEAHRVGSIFRDITAKVDEKGKLDYQDIRDLWSSLNLQRSGNNVLSSRQNYGSNLFPVIWRDDLLAAVKAKGLAVGLTQHEIDRTLALLGESYDGRSIPDVDINDHLNGLNLDGRWVLSTLWISILQRNVWEAGIPNQTFREAIASNISGANLDYTEPFTPVLGSAISNSNSYSDALMLRILKVGPDLGNSLFYDWYGHVLSSIGVDLTDASQRQTFIAQALKDALEFQVTGVNAGTGLEDVITGRANLNLIQDDGIPLHEGWGKDQRPFSDNIYSTQFLVDNFQILPDVPTLNRVGQLLYAQRDCKGCLKNFQSVSQTGNSVLITVDEVNGQNVLTVQPHAVDQATYFNGNFATDQIPIDVKKKHKKH